MSVVSPRQSCLGLLAKNGALYDWSIELEFKQWEIGRSIYILWMARVALGAGSYHICNKN